MASVFLSYARGDVQRVELLAKAIEKAGHRVWWDRRLSGGVEFDKAIESALAEAEIVVVAWSESASQSAWVRDEAAVGRDNRRLVPLSLDGTLPPLGFRQFHTLDLSSWRGSSRAREFLALLDAIEATGERAGAGTAEEMSTSLATDAGPATQGARSHSATCRAPARLWPWRVAAAGLFVALALGIGGRLLLEPRAEAMTIQFAEFSRLGGDVPAEIPSVLRQELKTAFGEDNSLAVKEDGASFILGGSVQRLGDKLHYTLQLKSAATGELLWTATRDHDLAMAAASPRQIANVASFVIRCGLADAMQYSGRLPTRILSLYLQHCRITTWHDDGGPDRALDVIRKVVEQAPDFSRGWSALAFDAAQAARRAPADKAASLRREAQAAIRKALDLDPRNGEAYVAAAALAPPGDWARREQLYRRSVEVRQSDCGCEHEHYGYFLLSIGRAREAAGEFARAVDMQPRAPSADRGLAAALGIAGDSARAAQVLNDATAFWTESRGLKDLALTEAIWARRWAEGAKLAATGIADGPERAAIVEAFSALASGAKARMAAAASALERATPSPLREDERMMLLAMLGSGEAALSGLEKTAARDGAASSYLLLDPSFAGLRDDPRYAALLNRIGLIGFWRQSRRPPDMCIPAGAPRFCAGTR